MSGLIDYAGMFPPTALPLHQALLNFARYRSEQDAWMLSRFIVPSTALQELDAYADLFNERPPFRFSVTLKGGTGYDSFLDNYHSTLERIRSFESKHGKKVRIEMIEARLPVPGKAPDNPEKMLPFFELVERSTLDTLGHSLDLFFEIPWQVTFKDDFQSTHDDLFDHAATAIQWYNKQPEDERIHLGFKLRCGGVYPQEVPAPEVVASALSHVIRCEIPFKATAGLHHPVREYYPEFGGKMHGFLNVFGAALLGRTNKLNVQQLIEIISDEDPSAFTLNDNTFTWRNLSVPLDELEKARAAQFISYGSCSFDEPREDLVDLKLLR